MGHRLDVHRASIDEALDAGASKRSIARALGVSVGTLTYYLDTRDLDTGKDATDIQAALARLAADVKS